MLANIFLFEFQQGLRRISTYVYFVVFFALGCLFTLMSGGAFSGASVDFGTGGKVLINSPYALNSVVTYICFFGIIITAAIAGQATYQDIDSNSAVFFYTAPIRKIDYLGGRFLAALAVQILIFCSVGLGAWLGTMLPWIDKTRLGPQMAAAYVQPYFINVVPNLMFLTAIFFALAALSRRMLPVYVASVLVLISYLVFSQTANTMSASLRAALCDPLGSRHRPHHALLDAVSAQHAAHSPAGSVASQPHSMARSGGRFSWPSPTRSFSLPILRREAGAGR